MRRQRKILLYSIVVFLIMVAYIAMFQDDIQIQESQYQFLTEKCPSTSAHNLLGAIVSTVYILKLKQHNPFIL